MDERHQNDVETKKETEKWQQEDLDLRLTDINQQRNDNENETHLNKLLIEKDNKIHELSTLLRKAKV